MAPPLHSGDDGEVSSFEAGGVQVRIDDDSLRDSEARAAKLRACASYVTQLGFQFGGAGALAERLEAQQAERLHPHFP